eukprot:jgi/Phyca11/133437/e_gw1.471.1.1
MLQLSSSTDTSVSSAVSANWTVKDAGSTAPPSSDDYSTWTVEQLRKECTSRKLRLSRKTPGPARVKYLLEFDEAHRAVVGKVLTPNSLLQSKNCVFRLMNVLFSDKLASRFAQTGNTATRKQLDAGDINAGSTFWRDVVSEFNTNFSDYNQLLSSNARFANIDTSMIVIHDVVTLYDMWKGVNRKYMKAMAKFTKSGEHGDDFYDFCGGALEVYYLRECLEVKRHLADFVEGGMLSDDEFDSIDRVAKEKPLLQSPPAKKLKCELVESVKMLTAKLEPAGSSVDKILKMHQLIGHVEDRIAALEARGAPATFLNVSLALYREKLCEMEVAFTKE